VKRALPDGLELDDERARVDVAAVHRYLSGESYWARGRPLGTVERLVREAARVVGLYDGDRLVGFCRVVTDGTAFAWLADVYVLDGYRSRGLGVELVRRPSTAVRSASCPGTSTPSTRTACTPSSVWGPRTRLG
jgi:GNAT superfamily N-acetyltransferase